MKELEDAHTWIQRQKARSGKLSAKSVGKTAQSVTRPDGLLESQVQVSHDLEDFQAGKEHILVLKDSDILNDEDDMLIDSSIPLKKNKGKLYTGYDDDEFLRPGHKINILSQYDEEDDKIVTKGFKISASTATQLSSKEKVEEKDSGISCFVEKKIIQDHDTTFKKIKKKKKTRKKETDLSIDLKDVELGSMSNKKKIIGDFVDDDELQNAISLHRKEKIKMGAEFVANVLSNQKVDSSSEDEGGLVISEATEFVRNLGKDEVEFKKEIKREEEEDVKVKEEDLDLPDTHTYNHVDEKKVHFEDMDVDIKQEEEKPQNISEETAFHAEPLVSSGLGATLALLSQKGLVQRLSPEEQERANKLRERELWLVEQRKKEKLKIAEREKERENQRNRKLSGRDLERQREIDAKRLEREQIRLKEEKFKNYVPDVKIAYYDEFGRELNTKEAYKQLAHKFHGHMPGKKKAEKRLQRIEEERKAKLADSISATTAEVVSETLKQTGNAYITLSVGNRAAKLPTIAPKVKPPPPAPVSESLPQNLTENKDNQSIDETREKIAFGLKRKAPSSTETSTKKPKEEK